MTRTAILLTDVNDTLETSEGRATWNKEPRNLGPYTGMAPSGCVSSGKSPDLSGQWFPHLKIEEVGLPWWRSG